VADSSVADYCRAVEAHLTRINGGHLVRVVGPAFALVRQWQAEGVPLSIVQRAIEQKAERHQRGAGARNARALRIEFVEEDVRALFEEWKRASGVFANLPSGDAAAEPRRASASKHLERASDRLSRLLGRQDLPEPFLDAIGRAISELGALRERVKPLRGAARDEALRVLKTMDAPLLAAARDALSAQDRAAIERAAAQELAPFEARLSREQWSAAMAATTERLVRERFALPVLDSDGTA
jgi:hypothetical protein